ncbi:MAG: tetratricopeptide repeat protein, partial [Hyphomonadaceae bacterium]|nr:tetratricopeptide repeat protein [Hyphomonadaceae bacterium]
MTESGGMARQQEGQKPKPFQGVRRLIEDIQGACPKGDCIFRGEPRDYGEVSSGIYRLGQKLKVEKDDSFRPMDIERMYVEGVMKGLGHYSPHASNVEILTDLRHHGGPTNLIDFSRNMFAALFFACNSETDDDGRLIILPTEKIGTLRNIEYGKIESGERRTDIALLTLARTQHSRAHVAAQSGVFVHAPKGCIDKNEFAHIEIIPSELKTECKAYLRHYHNIWEQTVYNDPVGYIENAKTYQEAMVYFSQGLAKGRGSDGEGPASAFSQALRTDTSSPANRLDDLTGWMQLKPDNTDALFRYSNNKKTRERYGEAIKNFDKALRIRPDFAEALFYRGKAGLAVGEHEEAMADFDKAIRLAPDNVGAWLNRGIAKGQLGWHKHALADYDEAIRLAPENAGAWLNRGIAKGQLGKHKEALADYDEAIRLAPENAGAWFRRGVSKGQLGKHKEALADYDGAIKLAPDDVGAWLNRGIAKRRLGRHKEALADYDEALRLAPENAGAWFHRGVSKGQLGRHEEAMADFDEAIRLAPDRADAWFHRGDCKKQLGRHEEAMADFDEAIRLAPENAGAWLNRGIAKGQLGKHKEALADYDEALRLAPD